MTNVSLDLLKQYLDHLSERELQLLGDMVVDNAEFVAEQGVGKYQVVNTTAGDWVLARDGDWHEDSSTPLRASSRFVLDGFVLIVAKKHYELNGEYASARSEWAAQAQMLRDHFAEGEMLELEAVANGLVLVYALPIPDAYDVASESGGKWSVRLLGIPLPTLRDIKSKSVADYALANIRMRMTFVPSNEASETLPT
jgi:hypothetical protein